MTPEGKVKANLKQRILFAFPKAYQFWPVLNGMGAPALDAYYCIDGRFVAFETKAKGKSLTPRQKFTKGEIERAGGLVFEVNPDTDIDHIIEVISLSP